VAKLPKSGVWQLCVRPGPASTFTAAVYDLRAGALRAVSRGYGDLDLSIVLREASLIPRGDLPPAVPKGIVCKAAHLAALRPVATELGCRLSAAPRLPEAEAALDALDPADLPPPSLLHPAEATTLPAAMALTTPWVVLDPCLGILIESGPDRLQGKVISRMIAYPGLQVHQDAPGWTRSRHATFRGDREASAQEQQWAESYPAVHRELAAQADGTRPLQPSTEAALAALRGPPRARIEGGQLRPTNDDDDELLDVAGAALLDWHGQASRPRSPAGGAWTWRGLRLRLIELAPGEWPAPPSGRGPHLRADPSGVGWTLEAPLKRLQAILEELGPTLPGDPPRATLTLRAAHDSGWTLHPGPPEAQRPALLTLPPGPSPFGPGFGPHQGELRLQPPAGAPISAIQVSVIERSADDRPAAAAWADPQTDGLLRGATWTGPPATWPRSSSVLYALLSPVAIMHRPPDAIAGALEAAVRIWNHDQPRARAGLPPDPDARPAHAAPLSRTEVQRLLMRKRALFARDHRIYHYQGLIVRDGVATVLVSWSDR
jgi:hypothetical protein